MFKRLRDSATINHFKFFIFSNILKSWRAYLHCWIILLFFYLFYKYWYIVNTICGFPLNCSVEGRKKQKNWALFLFTFYTVYCTQQGRTNHSVTGGEIKWNKKVSLLEKRGKTKVLCVWREKGNSGTWRGAKDPERLPAAYRLPDQIPLDNNDPTAGW